MKLVSTKPYLIRAIYEWCVDQGLTPHLAVLVDDRVLVPPGYAREGQIVLDISPGATHQLAMGNDAISFQARFGGVAHALSIPITSVLAVYASENGQGMAFEAEAASVEEDADPAALLVDEISAEGESASPSDDGGDSSAGRRSHLKIVK